MFFYKENINKSIIKYQGGEKGEHSQCGLHMISPLVHFPFWGPKAKSHFSTVTGTANYLLFFPY